MRYIESEVWKRGKTGRITIYKIKVPDTDYENLCKKQHNLWKDNFPLILHNSEEILKNSRYYSCTNSNFFISIAYISTPTLCLGHLIECWKQGLMQSINEEGSIVYISSFGGSPLSGTNKFFGQTENAQIVTGSFSSFKEAHKIIDYVQTIKHRYISHGISLEAVINELKVQNQIKPL